MLPPAVVLHFRVKPNARVTSWSVHDGGLILKLAAPPVDGKANAALIKFVAKSFLVAVSSVEIMSGHTAPFKKVKITAPQQLPPDVLPFIKN